MAQQFRINMKMEPHVGQASNMKITAWIWPEVYWPLGSPLINDMWVKQGKAAIFHCPPSHVTANSANYIVLRTPTACLSIDAKRVLWLPKNLEEDWAPPASWHLARDWRQRKPPASAGGIYQGLSGSIRLEGLESPDKFVEGSFHDPEP